MTSWTAGDLVTLSGLVGRRELNLRFGRVQRWVAARQRYLVALDVCKYDTTRFDLGGEGLFGQEFECEDVCVRSVAVPCVCVRQPRPHPHPRETLHTTATSRR